MKLLFSILLCIPLLLHAQEDSLYSGIKFEQGLSWEQVKAKALANNKYIFVDCYATWCGPCKMMDRDVYGNSFVGKVMNENFVSVKVQMDSTEEDNAYIKSWYNDVTQIKKTYRIGGYPTYLYFSPAGKLVHQEMGYVAVKKFLQQSELARDPRKALYYAQYESYKSGTKDYKAMGELALFTRNLIGDIKTASKMAKDYKENVLSKLDTTELFNPENISFINTFPDIVDSNDAFFSLCYKNPKKFDSLLNSQGWAKRIVIQTISREEIDNKVLKDGLAYTKMPGWKPLQDNIAKKYKSVNANQIVLAYKVSYYKNLYKDWRLWAAYKDEMIKKYTPPPPYGVEVYVEINGDEGAWYAFKYCSDTTVLKKALEWVELSLKIDGEDIYKRASYWDTKANLLYKLGRNEEALILEKAAIDLASKGNTVDFVEAYHKMKQNEPTWPVK